MAVLPAAVPADVAGQPFLNTCRMINSYTGLLALDSLCLRMYMKREPSVRVFAATVWRVPPRKKSGAGTDGMKYSKDTVSQEKARRAL